MQIAYLMTHYPRVALTFISGEIDAIEQSGMPILPIALNGPDPADLPTAEAVDRAAQTRYLKASLWQLGRAVLVSCLCNPVAMMQLIWLAMRSARSRPRAVKANDLLADRTHPCRFRTP